MALLPIPVSPQGQPRLYQQLALYFAQSMAVPEQAYAYTVADLYNWIQDQDGGEEWLQTTLSTLPESVEWQPFDAKRRAKSSFKLEAPARLVLTGFLAYWVGEIIAPTMYKRAAFKGKNGLLGISAGATSSGTLYYDDWREATGDCEVEAALTEAAGGTSNVHITIFKSNKAVALYVGSGDAKLLGVGTGTCSWN